MTNKFAVKEIQFLSRDVCAGFEKELVYIWYVAHSHLVPSAPYQTVLKKYPLTNQSKTEICNKLIDTYMQELNVSSKCKYLAFVNEFLESYPQYEDKLEQIHILPIYSVETTPISNVHDELPNNVCIWELNHIAPALTGMFYENMLNYIIRETARENKNKSVYKELCKRMNSECNDVSELLYGNQHNINTNAIMSLLNRHFLDKNKMQYGCFRAIVKNKKICIEAYDETEKLKEEHFRNRYVYILWISFLHFLKIECKSSIVVDVLRSLDYVQENMEIINEYYNGLSKSTLVRKLINRFDVLDIEHGKSFRSPKIRGEVDFITPNSVIDIKCYKTDEKELWAGQLFLYMSLAQGTKNINDNEYNLTEGVIVNLFNNEMYTYKFENRVQKYSDLIPDFSEEEEVIDKI